MRAEQWRCVTDKVITIEQAYAVTHVLPFHVYFHYNAFKWTVSVKAAQIEMNESDRRPHGRKNSARTKELHTDDGTSHERAITSPS